MTENEAIKLHVEELKKRIDRIKEFIEFRPKEDNSVCYKNINIMEKIIQSFEELQQYRAIGTVEEFKALKENERKCEDCAGCTNWLCDCANERAKAIDDAKETVAKAICVGCGYLDGYKCNYKGANCGVSKPMLESVVKALEQMKGAVQ